jgi:hypothetical protein
MLGVHVCDESREIRRLAAGVHRRAPVREIDRAIVEQHAARRRDAAYTKVDVEGLA